MNALVKKEIRLLLPSWLTVLLVATLLPWVWKTDGTVITWSPGVLFFGAMLIAVESFGREFSLGTFSSLMSQPVERRKIWRNKIAVLAAGVAIIFIVQLASYELWFHWWLPVSGSLSYISLGDNWWMWVGAAAALMLVAASGGLWTTLWLRQAAAAMWITFLTPVALLLLIALLPSQMFQSIPDLVAESALFGVAGLYVVAGFLLARWLFYRAQDAGWTGGVITLPEWGGFLARSGDVISIRKQRPVFALLKKEFQLQQVALTGAAGLLVLHIGVILLREYHKFSDDSLGLALTTIFWVVWLLMAPIVGGMAVAEERRLGVMEGQLCLPVSGRVQFAIKLILTVLLGAFLGGVMPMLVERIAAEFGVHHSMFASENKIGGDFGAVGFELAVVAMAAGLTFVSFYASTLARSFLQALGLAIATVFGCALVIPWAAHTKSFFGIISLSSPLLEVIVAVPTLLVTLRWLGYLNFTNLQYGWPLWRRNLIGMMAAVLFVVVVSTLIYNRVWGIFERAEPPHGAPRFSLSDPPTLQGNAGGLLVRLSDGRIWFDSLGYPFLDEGRRNPWREAWLTLLCPLPKSDGPYEFKSGSNYLSVAARHVTYQDPAGHWDVVGIRTDGTLWISGKDKSNIWTEGGMIRVGDETNWLRVVRMSPGFLFLKKDGTIWQRAASRSSWIGWSTGWPRERISKSEPIGTNSDWKEIFSDGTGYARKTDGSVWVVHVGWSTGKDRPERKANLDQVVSQTFSRVDDDRMAYVGKDGALWVGEGTGRFVQAGRETNWVAVAVAWNCGVALKTDGTLWKWNNPNSTPEVAGIRPRRLGIHNDWVGLTVSRTAVVSLAADGSLWYWPSTGYYERTLLKAPNRPQLLGNVFSGTH